MKQGFAQLALIALILLLISSGLAVFLTTKNESRQKPTPSPLPQYQTEETISTDEGNANWKTYTNKEYGYSIKYPTDWELKENSGSDKSARLSPAVAPCPSGANPLSCEYAEFISISVSENPNNLSIEDFVDPNKSYTMKFESIRVNNIEAKRTLDRPGQFENEDVYIKYEGKIYQITLIKNLGAKRVSNEIFDQILSTYKFLDPSLDTSNWKVYQGKSFSFKYPSDWKEETAPASYYHDSLEAVGFRLPGSAVFGAERKNYSMMKYLQSRSDDTPQKITVGGKDASLFEDKGQQGSALPMGYSIITVIVQDSEDTSYLVGFNGNRNDITDDLVTQILSTFKFTE